MSANAAQIASIHRLRRRNFGRKDIAAVVGLPIDDVRAVLWWRTPRGRRHREAERREQQKRRSRAHQIRRTAARRLARQHKGVST